MLALEVEHATKFYGDAAAIEDVSFVVEERQPTAILGPSGCGKTTTLRTIAGLTGLDQGVIRILGSDVTRLRPFERGIGLVFQNYALFPHMKVDKNIAYGLRMRRESPRTIRRKVREALETVRLSGFDNRWPRELSGGEQQRVALARAIVTEPSVLLLDEPLSNLDANLRREMRLELQRIFESVDTTPIIVTHDQIEALSLGSKVVVMKKGAIAQIGSPSDVYFKPNSKFVADFIGEMNWFQGGLHGNGSDVWRFHSAEGFEFKLSDMDRPIQAGSNWLGVRPERVFVEEFSASTAADDRPRNVLYGRLERAETVGGNIDLVVRLDDSDRGIRAAMKNRGRIGIGVGDRVRVVIAPEDCIPIAGDGASQPEAEVR